MPITINYNNFINPVSDLIPEVTQPHQYMSIYTGVTNLRSDDPIIIFTNLPNGTRILDDPATTEPYDSIFMDFESMNDYVLMNDYGDNYWQADGGTFVASYTSGGFWAIGDATTTVQAEPFVFATGAGNAESSILDISFVPISYTYTEDIYIPTNNENLIIELEKGGSYLLDTYNNLRFHQTENTNWYAANIKRPAGQVYSAFNISGIAFTGGSYQTVTIPEGGDEFEPDHRHIYWNNGQLLVASGLYTLPEPFTNYTFSQGYSWNTTIANEILSNYTVISGNDNNNGTGVIQLNTQASNGQSFSSLISPLRKLYINFSRL